MPLTVAFVSQKGGVGKSTLARSLAVVAAGTGLRVLLADLDTRQKTLMLWAHEFDARHVSLPLRVEAFRNVKEALISAQEADLLIVDTPGQIDEDTDAVVANAHLIVQPTSPSLDDLRLAVFVFEALMRVGIPQERLVFALCSVLADKEGEAARSDLKDKGYQVLTGSILEHLAYRDALNHGRAITETRYPKLNARAFELVTDLLERLRSGKETASAA